MKFQKSEFEKILSEIEKYRKKDEALNLKFDEMITNVFSREWRCQPRRLKRNWKLLK